VQILTKPKIARKDIPEFAPYFREWWTISKRVSSATGEEKCP